VGRFKLTIANGPSFSYKTAGEGMGWFIQLSFSFAAMSAKTSSIDIRIVHRKEAQAVMVRKGQTP
jgi:hypothetical protein